MWAGVGYGPAYGRSQAAALQVAQAAASHAASRCSARPRPSLFLGFFSGSGHPKATPAVHSFLMSQQQPGASGRRGHLLSDAP